MNNILEIIPHPFLYGGIESFLLNIIKNMEIDSFTIDIYTPYCEDNCHFAEIVNSLGGHVYSEGKQFSSGFNQFKGIARTIRFLKTHRYDIIHIHSCSSFVLAFYSIIARIFHAKKIIVHSHSTGSKKSIKYWLLRFFSLIVFCWAPTEYLACSEKAAEWKYSKAMINRRVHIIKNGISLDDFRINNEKRVEYRTLLGYTDSDFIIGHVGRFADEKNHEFIIDIFAELHKKSNKYKLLLIGDSKLKIHRQRR